MRIMARYTSHLKRDKKINNTENNPMKRPKPETIREKKPLNQQSIPRSTRQHPSKTPKAKHNPKTHRLLP